MIIEDTKFYDNLEIRLAEIVEENAVELFGDNETPERLEALSALYLCNSVVMGIADVVHKTHNQELNEGTASPENEHLYQRIISAFRLVDQSRVANEDHDYFQSVSKNVLDLIAEPSATEKEIEDSGESSVLWKEVMSSFLQIRTFYEIKVSGETEL